MSDGHQALNFKQFEDMMEGGRRLANAMSMKV
jgi:hypothetical protein